jgi:hypothetical protein
MIELQSSLARDTIDPWDRIPIPEQWKPLVLAKIRHPKRFVAGIPESGMRERECFVELAVRRTLDLSEAGGVS